MARKSGFGNMSVEIGKYKITKICNGNRLTAHGSLCSVTPLVKICMTQMPLCTLLSFLAGLEPRPIAPPESRPSRDIRVQLLDTMRASCSELLAPALTAPGPAALAGELLGESPGLLLSRRPAIPQLAPQPHEVLRRKVPLRIKGGPRSRRPWGRLQHCPRRHRSPRRRPGGPCCTGRHRRRSAYHWWVLYGWSPDLHMYTVLVLGPHLTPRCQRSASKAL
jgi:hypothetical protein